MLTSIDNIYNTGSMDSSLSNRYWARTNYGLSLPFNFIKRYFLKDLVYKRLIRRYNSIEEYKEERESLMSNILRDFIDKEVYHLPLKEINEQHYAVILSFNGNNFKIIGPLCKSREQAKIESMMTLYKILYHFNCKLFPFIEGNNQLMKKISNNSDVNSQVPDVFSRKGWTDIKKEYYCFENLYHPKYLFYISIIDFLDDPKMNYIDPITGKKKRMYIGYLTKKPIPSGLKNFYCFDGNIKTQFSIAPWDKFHNSHSQNKINALEKELKYNIKYSTDEEENDNNNNNNNDYILDNSDCQSYLPVNFNRIEYEKIKKFQNKLWGLLCISQEFKMNKETEDMYYILPFYKDLEKENSKIAIDWDFINQSFKEQANPNNLTIADWMVTIDYLIDHGQKDLVSTKKTFEENFFTIRDTFFTKINNNPSLKKYYHTYRIKKENFDTIHEILLNNTYFRTIYNNRIFLYNRISEYIVMDDTFSPSQNDRNRNRNKNKVKINENQDQAKEDTIKNKNKDDNDDDDDDNNEDEDNSMEGDEITYRNFINERYDMVDYDYQYINLPLMSGKVFSLLKNYDYYTDKQLEGIRIQKENKIKNHIPTGFRIWYIPELCEIFYLPSYWINFLQHIPVITYKLKCYCIMDEFRYEIGLKYLSVENLLYSSTFKVADIIIGDRHEQFEFLGDTVLKYFSTMDLLNTYHDADESTLTQKRIAHVNNGRLIKLINQLQWNRFFINKKFTIGHFKPPNVYITEGNKIKEAIMDNRDSKPKADFFESLIGACFVDGKNLCQSLQLSKHFLYRTGIITSLNYHWKPSINKFQIHSLPLFNYDHAVKHICQVFNHTYSKDSVLYTVLYEIALDGNNKDYQRLEYLGDAVLDLISINYFFNKFKKANPKELTQYKHMSVQNQVFANIIIEQGIIDDIPTNSQSVQCNDYLKKRKTEKTLPPKFIADLFEVLVGAIHIDNHYEFEKTNAELSNFLYEHIYNFTQLDQSVEEFEIINECIELFSCLGKEFSNQDGFIRNPKIIYKLEKVSNNNTLCCINLQFKENEFIPLNEFKVTANNKKIAKRSCAHKVLSSYHKLGKEEFKSRLYERISHPSKTFTLDYWN